MPRRTHRKTLILQTLSIVIEFCLLIATTSLGQTTNDSKISRLETSEENIAPSAYSIFGKRYVSLGVGKNYPVDKGARLFQPGYYHPTLGYRYILDDSWLLGISTQFKVLKARDSGQTTSFFSIEEQSQKILRLYHPFYLLMGGKFMYLLPATKPRFPVQKNSDLEIEMGAGATISLLYRVAQSKLCGVYIDQWRGTKTTKLQAIETGFFISAAVGD